MTSKKSKKILFVYRTTRRSIYDAWYQGKGPDTLLYGANHMKRMGYEVDFFDDSYSPLNLFHPFFYLLEHAISAKIGMGFKIDQAMALFPKFKNYDVIVGTADSANLPILLLKYCGILKTPIVYITAGLAGALKGKNDSIIAKFYKKLLPMAEVIIAYSQVELDFFENDMNIPKDKLNYIPLGIDWQYFSKRSKLRKGIISALGEDSGRDYETLFRAVKELPVKVEIACHKDSIKNLKIPKNVKVHLNAPIELVRNIFQRSKLTIVPCHERYRSAGQIVLLSGSSSGLPIIASKIRGITSAFDFQNKKHLLFVKPENAQDLKDKIVYLLNNKKHAKQMGSKASALVKKKYTTKHLAINLEKLINSL